MTTVVVMAEPPRPGSLSGLSEVLDADARERLATAFLQDCVRSAALAAGDMVIVVRDGADMGLDEDTAQAAVRSALQAVEPVETDSIRLERAVGSTPSARVGNTVTHLLDEEAASSAIILWPGTPLVRRATIDEAAMKLRQHDAVFAPAGTANVALCGFGESIDFTDVLDRRPLVRLTDRAHDAGCTVDFVGDQVRVTDPPSLAALCTRIRARRRAERVVPVFTTAAIDNIGLDVEATSTGLRPVQN